MSLTKEQIFQCTDIKIEKLHIEAWGGDIYVRSMTGTERDKFESSNVVKDRKTQTYDVRMENLRTRLVVLTVCDETGGRIFTDEDAKEIGRKNAAVIAQIYDVAARLSGITKEDIEEITKNSLGEPSDVSQ